MERSIAPLICLLVLISLVGCTLFGGGEGEPTGEPTEGSGTDSGPETSTGSDGAVTTGPSSVPEPTRPKFGVDECSHAIVDGNCPENCDIIDDVDCCMTEQPGTDGLCPEGWKLIEDRYCFDIAMCDMTYPGFG